jgi:hypothetical protein
MKLFLICSDCGRPRIEKAQGFCGGCYNRRWVAGTLPARRQWGDDFEYAARFRARHLAKTKITEKGCWEYQGLRNDAGYGLTNLRKEQMFLHRASFTLFCEPIKLGNLVRHTCDNPPCWNPEHLVQGTHTDNAEDAIDRGRKPVGQKVYNAKITNAQALEIRQRALAGENHRKLAAEFGIARTSVGRIARGQIWRHAA